MATTTISIENLPEFLQNLTADFAKSFAAEAASRVIDLTPVLTGGLRGSIGIFKTAATDNSGIKDASGDQTKGKVMAQAQALDGLQDMYVTSGADYSEDVEFGTASRSARPFMRPVVAEAQSIADQVAKDI